MSSDIGMNSLLQSWNSTGEFVGRVCENFHDYPKERWCEFYENVESCELEESFIEYVEVVLCSDNADKDSYFIGMNILYSLWCLWLFIALGLVADAFFVPNLTKISSQLKLSENVAGVTLVAFGTALQTYFLQSPALVLVYSNSIRPFSPAARPLLRDVIFYLWSLYWLLQCLYKGRIEMFDAVGFIVLYIIYVTTVGLGGRFGKILGLTKAKGFTYDDVNDDTVEEAKDSLPASKFASARNTMTLDGETRSRSNTATLGIAKNRIRALSNVSGQVGGTPRPTILSVQQSNEVIFKTRRDYLKEMLTPWDPEEWEEGGIISKILAVFMAPLYLIAKLTVPVVGEDEKETWNRPLAYSQAVSYPWLWYILLQQYGRQYSNILVLFITTFKKPLSTPSSAYFLFTIPGFLAGMLWVFVLANEVVGLLTALGFFWKINNVVMGLTFLAWANSIGDLVADLGLSRIGKAGTAVAACFGSPLLNLLVGTGIGCTISIASNDWEAIDLDLRPLEVALLGSTTVVLLCLLVILPIIKYNVGRALGIFQIVLYIGGLVLCVLLGTS
uniref:Sodium/calcium exchanger protein-like protein n=1 Tax=Oikopleura dioica TaxID=34765 RepID=Q66S42_OIKDI|nr:sodium/calcium exchanger protein-like protein [Oikopleura dioica]